MDERLREKRKKLNEPATFLLEKYIFIHFTFCESSSLLSTKVNDSFHLLGKSSLGIEWNFTFVSSFFNGCAVGAFEKVRLVLIWECKQKSISRINVLFTHFLEINSLDFHGK